MNTHKGGESLVVVEDSVLAFDGHLCVVAGLAVADDAGVDVEALGDVDDALGGGFVGVEFHAVPHVEDGVHLLPVGAALLVDETEEGWGGEEVVLDDMEVVDEVQYLGLGTSAAVYHAVDFGPVSIKDATHDGCIGACGRKDHASGINVSHFGGVGQALLAAVDHLARQVGVVALGEVLGIKLAEDIVACRSEAIAAHAAVVGCFV